MSHELVDIAESFYGVEPRVRRHRREGFVYFIQRGEHGPVKIGWSVNPRKRLSVLRSSSAESLRILRVEWTSRQRERELHERLDQYRIGGEWFAPAPQVLAAAGIRPTE